MFSDADIQYALETTRVLREPDRRIDTFGSTRFEFQLISELMDSVGKVRVRNGRIEADRPKILRPEGYSSDLMFEGFGEQAEQFGQWLKRRGLQVALLQYGFSFRKTEVTEDIVHEAFPAVCDRLAADAESSGNPMRAVIRGVDDTWEICLLKFTMEMIEKSQGINIFDFKRRGLL